MTTLYPLSVSSRQHSMSTVTMTTDWEKYPDSNCQSIGGSVLHDHRPDLTVGWQITICLSQLYITICLCLPILYLHLEVLYLIYMYHIYKTKFSHFYLYNICPLKVFYMVHKIVFATYNSNTIVHSY